MTSYYPSQGYAPSAQPMMYSASAGYAPQQAAYQMAPSASYAQPAVMVQPQMVPSMGAAPVMMQPAYSQAYAPQAQHYTLGARIRRFFGLAPPVPNGMKFKSDRTTWGFMGYSRRQRYIDARTGAEVDKHGRPVIRV